MRGGGSAAPGVAVDDFPGPLVERLLHAAAHSSTRPRERQQQVGQQQVAAVAADDVQHPPGERGDVGRHRHGLFGFVAAGQHARSRAHDGLRADGDEVCGSTLSLTWPAIWPSSCACSSVVVPVGFVQADDDPFLHLAQAAEKAELALPQRTIDDDQHHVRIAGRSRRRSRRARPRPLRRVPAYRRASTLSLPGQGISCRCIVVPPRGSVWKTSRPASALSSDDLPLDTVPNATISSLWLVACFDLAHQCLQLLAHVGRQLAAALQLLDGCQVVGNFLRLLSLRKLAGTLRRPLAGQALAASAAPERPDRAAPSKYQKRGADADQSEIGVRPARAEH